MSDHLSTAMETNNIITITIDNFNKSLLRSSEGGCELLRSRLSISFYLRGSGVCNTLPSRGERRRRR